MLEDLSIQVLGSRLSPVSCSNAVEIILRAARDGRGGHVCLSNVHTVTLGRTDVVLRRATNSALLALADGRPLTWIARLRGYRDPKQVRGADLLRETCRAAADSGIPIYLFGGAAGVAEELATKLKSAHRSLDIAGWECPPFRTLTPEEHAASIARIRASGARILWICLGAPYQEKWMLEHADQLTGIVSIGVGAAFDFEVGRIQEAPRWAQRLGVEWLHRLFQDPSRLWRRYLVTNISFVFYGLLESCNINTKVSEN